MAYYSGLATSYSDLLNSLVNACISNGWTWSDEILSKGSAFVKVQAKNQQTPSYKGIVIQGGTGKSGSNLVNPSFSAPRLGNLGTGAQSPEVTFPCNYFIHIFNSPDEVYLIVKFDIESFYYLSFGISDINLSLTNGTGLWLSATAKNNVSTNPDTNGFIIRNDGTGGGAVSGNFSYTSGGPFYNSLNGIQFKADSNNTIHTGLGSDAWAGSYETVNGNLTASLSLAPLIARVPSEWSSNSVLLPINIYQGPDAAFKVKQVAGLKNARYVRINNYAPEQIIQLGSDKWKIYPFFKKNASSPNSSIPLYNHTGTFGWAIKYDGP